MAMYDYRCISCSHQFETLRSMEDRKTAECPKCGESANQVIVSFPALDPRMGTDPDFPSAAQKWEKKHIALATGRMKDSNATRMGTNVDVERDAYNLRKIYES